MIAYEHFMSEKNMILQNMTEFLSTSESDPHSYEVTLKQLQIKPAEKIIILQWNSNP